MDDDLPLHYLSPDDIELQGSRAKLFQIALTAEQVEALTGDASQVDVYVPMPKASGKTVSTRHLPAKKYVTH